MNTPKNIIFIGPQGSGKGTQAKILVKKIGAEYIETGAMLRAITHLDSDFGRHIRSMIDHGKMVDDQDIEDILGKRLKIVHKNTSLIFDGVPRRIGQAEFILKTLKEIGREKLTTLFFPLSHDQSVERLMKRRICTVCGRTTIANGELHQFCDKCGSEVVRRKDDTPEFIRQRLDTYDKETLPVVEYLKTVGDFFEIDGSQGIQEVAKEVEKIFGLTGAPLIKNFEIPSKQNEEKAV